MSDSNLQVNQSDYQQHHHEYVYDSSEEDEVASLYDLDLYKRNHHLKSRRRVRAESVRSFDNESLEDESVQVECVECGDDPEYAIEYRFQDLKILWENRVHEPNTALIAVEACHISPWDVAIRRGLYRPGTVPCVLGSNFVGVVHATSNEASSWRIGRRVAGLPLKGGNAKYVTATPDQLFDVPKRLDASEVSCLLSIYLPTFQALHHGQPSSRRYSQQAFQRKSVLVTGTDGALPEALAMIQLALFGGAHEVYIVGEREYHSVFRQLFAQPLDVHVDDWLPIVTGRMDVVIDFDYDHNESASSDALAPNGRLVWYVHPSKRESGQVRWLDGIVEQARMCLLERASMYELYDSWYENPNGAKVSSWYIELASAERVIIDIVTLFSRQIIFSRQRDFAFLLRLLAHRQIRPKIDKYIGIGGVKSAHKDLQTRSLTGAIVCEPWKDEDAMSVASTAASTSTFSTLGLISE